MAYGLKPVYNLDGTPFNGGTIKCAIASGDSTATFIGDLVKLAGSASTEGYPTVVQGAASDTAFFGVVTSFDPDPDNLSNQYRLADTARLCNVVPAGNALFQIQSDGPTDVGDVGETADVVVGSGSTSTGVSGMALDDSNIGTGLNLVILGIVNRPDNDYGTGETPDVIVKVNESLQNSLGGGADIGV